MSKRELLNSIYKELGLEEYIIINPFYSVNYKRIKYNICEYNVSLDKLREDNKFFVNYKDEISNLCDCENVYIVSGPHFIYSYLDKYDVHHETSLSIQHNIYPNFSSLLKEIKQNEKKCNYFIYRLELTEYYTLSLSLRQLEITKDIKQVLIE